MTALIPLHDLALEDALEVRRQRGIDTYRGGDGSRPFVGDAASEAFEEALDLVIYAEEMLQQGEPRPGAERVAGLALQALDALREILRGRGQRSLSATATPPGIHKSRRGPGLTAESLAAMVRDFSKPPKRSAPYVRRQPRGRQP